MSLNDLYHLSLTTSLILCALIFGYDAGIYLATWDVGILPSLACSLSALVIGSRCFIRSRVK